MSFNLEIIKQKIENKEINLGKHDGHEWEVIVEDIPSPHVGKIVCNTCQGKWVTWLRKGTF